MLILASLILFGGMSASDGRQSDNDEHNQDHVASRDLRTPPVRKSKSQGDDYSNDYAWPERPECEAALDAYEKNQRQRDKKIRDEMRRRDLAYRNIQKDGEKDDGSANTNTERIKLQSLMKKRIGRRYYGVLDLVGKKSFNPDNLIPLVWLVNRLSEQPVDTVAVLNNDIAHLTLSDHQQLDAQLSNEQPQDSNENAE